MVSAVVYNSLTGSCEKYANLLSAALHVPAKKLGEHVRKDSQVIYIGWAFAGKMAGWKKAQEKYNIAAAVQVGMSGGGEKAAAAAREANAVPSSIAVFALQGGFYMKKLPLHYRLIMKLKNKEIAGRLKGKESLNPQQQALMKMATEGNGDPAAWDISEVLAWCREQNMVY